jgi:hypothetical protein
MLRRIIRICNQLAVGHISAWLIPAASPSAVLYSISWQRLPHARASYRTPPKVRAHQYHGTVMHELEPKWPMYRNSVSGYTAKLIFCRTKALRGVYPQCRHNVWWGGVNPPRRMFGGVYLPMPLPYMGTVYPPQCRRAWGLPPPSPCESSLNERADTPHLYMVIPDVPQFTPPTSPQYLGGGLPPQLNAVNG